MWNNGFLRHVACVRSMPTYVLRSSLAIGCIWRSISSMPNSEASVRTRHLWFAGSGIARHCAEVRMFLSDSTTSRTFCLLASTVMWSSKSFCLTLRRLNSGMAWIANLGTNLRYAPASLRKLRKSLGGFTVGQTLIARVLSSISLSPLPFTTNPTNSVWLVQIRISFLSAESLHCVAQLVHADRDLACCPKISRHHQ